MLSFLIIPLGAELNSSARTRRAPNGIPQEGNVDSRLCCLARVCLTAGILVFSFNALVDAQEAQRAEEWITINKDYSSQTRSRGEAREGRPEVTIAGCKYLSIPLMWTGTS